MKKQVQLKLKSLVEEVELNGEDLFDSVVVNYRSVDEDEIENNELEGQSGCVIVLKTTKFDERAIKKGMNDTTNDGFMAMIWKKTCPDYQDKFETGPELVAQMILKNRTLDGLVRDCYPVMIDWNLYRAETIGVFMMAEFQFRVTSRFFVEKPVK